MLRFRPRFRKPPVRWALYSTNYNYNHQYKPPSTGRKILTACAVAGVAFGVATYIWWPKHTFPRTVAKTLRKGLWAESDKGEKDYELALKHYIEALQQCDELNLDKLSDEYTGIQLKIAEMYERLSMVEEANFLYNEIATLYLKTLTDPAVQISDTYRNHLIQKDLRIAIKLAELNKLNINLCKAVLITHSIPASLAIDTKLGQKLGDIAMENLDPKSSPLTYLPFLDEYINLSNLLIAISVSVGDYNYAINTNLNLNKLMLLVHYKLDKLLLTQCNLGSLLYLSSEIHELNMIKWLKDQGLYAKGDYLDLRSHTKKDPKYDTLYESFSKCLELSVKTYENVLTLSNDVVGALGALGALSAQEGDELTKVKEIVALSTYSLGVINLHLKLLDKAERLLREARVKCKECNYAELIGEIENELAKLFSERKKLEAAGSALDSV